MTVVCTGATALCLADLRRLAAGAELVLDAAALPGIEHSAGAIADILAARTTVYGINTGFGSLAHTKIPPGQLAELQRRLVLSHSVGVGEALPDDVVRRLRIVRKSSQPHTGAHVQD